MSTVKFAIKNTENKALKEGDSFLRFSGVSEPFIRVSEREAKSVGFDKEGKPRLVFTTGLSDKQVDFFKWYNKEEQAEVKKQIKNLRPIISAYYGGDDVIEDTNRYFWGENRDVSRLSLTNQDIDVFYDTANPVHALLYLSIISGAFIEMVAPTRDWAERHQIPHYMALETEDTFEDEDDITRSDAHAALSELRKEGSTEALFILAWCAQYDTNAFGGINKATPMRNLLNTHIQFIDGKLVSKKKRNMPKTFIEYFEKWKGQQTRPALYAEAYIKAGEYYNFIQSRDKKYVTVEGTTLGNTIGEAVQNIMKPKNSQDLENLRDKVEAKWSE